MPRDKPRRNCSSSLAFRRRFRLGSTPRVAALEGLLLRLSRNVRHARAEPLEERGEQRVTGRPGCRFPHDAEHADIAVDGVRELVEREAQLGIGRLGALVLVQARIAELRRMVGAVVVAAGGVGFVAQRRVVLVQVRDGVDRVGQRGVQARSPVPATPRCRQRILELMQAGAAGEARIAQAGELRERLPRD